MDFHLISFESFLIFIIFSFSFIIIQRKQKKKLRVEFAKLQRENAQINDYMNMFSKVVQTENDAYDWFNRSAEYIAELIDADGVGIYFYQEKNNELKDTKTRKICCGTLHFAGMNSRFQNRLHKEVMICEWDEDTKEKHFQENNALLTLAFDAMLKKDSLLINSNDSTSNLASIIKNERLTSFMSIPVLDVNQQPVGLIIVENMDFRQKSNFTQSQRDILSTLSSSIIVSHIFLTVYERLSSQQKIAQELEFVRKLQNSILPEKFPSWGKFHIFARSRSAKKVSGDFYDFVEIDTNRALVIIGDGSGKGIPACLIMAMTRSFIRAIIPHFTSLKDLLYELNSNLKKDMENNQYITLSICMLHKRDNTIEYVRAGHTPMIFYVRQHTRSINPSGGGLGLLPTEFLVDFDTFTTQFSPNSALLLYTDGINEALNEKGERFGIEQIRETFEKSCVNHENGEKIIDTLFTKVNQFTNTTDESTNRDDDQTIIVITQA